MALAVVLFHGIEALFLVIAVWLVWDVWDEFNIREEVRCEPLRSC